MEASLDLAGRNTRCRRANPILPGCPAASCSRATLRGLLRGLWQSFSAMPPAQPDLQPESARKLAPDFALTDVSGNPIKLSDSKGKVILLNFWATWCGGCQTEIPWFIEFQNKYKDAGLNVIGVSLDDDGWKSVTPYVKERT